MIRVAVFGACGKMGRILCGAIEDDPELDLVVAIDPSRSGTSLAGVLGRPDVEVTVSADAQALTDAGAQVAVDFTRPDAVLSNVRAAVERGVHVVVGTTGITGESLRDIEAWLGDAPGVGVVVAPNFSIGAVLAQRLSEEAARFFPAAEVVELHHDQKLDSPSGTAAATARRIAAARTEGWAGPEGGPFRGGEVEGIRVHSVRLPGLVAHQEVIFGGLGQTLSIRHDTTDRASFMPGVLLAIKEVGSRPGLTLGLEPLLDL
ncbi:MAG: 4-hydroxy-tetrahydrodipicolinate reductase [Actinomycetota bacterium]